jgi:predicted GNAT family acetyltransferase
MQIDRDSLEVLHKPDKSRFEIVIDEYVAELVYRLDGDVITFTHTGVPSELEGNGIGSIIVRAGLDYAREQGYKVVPLCSFVDSYMSRKPEYESLRA